MLRMGINGDGKKWHAEVSSINTDIYLFFGCRELFESECLRLFTVTDHFAGYLIKLEHGASISMASYTMMLYTIGSSERS